MKYHQLFIIPLLMLLMAGCTWQKIPPDPEYRAERPIPLRVGILAPPDSASGFYVPGVVAELKTMGLFDGITFPYREGDPVDAVATLSVDGEWKPSGIGPNVAVWLTLGLASPFIGPSVTGTHAIKAAMISGTEDVGFYSTKVSTTAEWGVMADSNEASAKTNELQIKRLADSLAKAIRENQTILLAKVKSASQSSTLAEKPLRNHPKASLRNPPVVASQIPPPPAAVVQNPQFFKQGLLSFEAERLAMQAGCSTANGVRPVALLVKGTNYYGIYDVMCQQEHMIFRCEDINCQRE